MSARISLTLYMGDGTPHTPRRSLRRLPTRWLVPAERRAAHMIAATGSDEDCARFLAELEGICNARAAQEGARR